MSSRPHAGGHLSHWMSSHLPPNALRATMRLAPTVGRCKSCQESRPDGRSLPTELIGIATRVPPGHQFASHNHNALRPQEVQRRNRRCKKGRDGAGVAFTQHVAARCCFESTGCVGGLLLIWPGYGRRFVRSRPGTAAIRGRRQCQTSRTILERVLLPLCRGARRRGLSSPPAASQ